MILSAWLGVVLLAAVSGCQTDGDTSGTSGTARAAATPALRVGVTPFSPPMVFRQGGELVGMDVDLARGLAERLGRPLKFVEISWEDQMEALINRRTDIIMSSVSITDARRVRVDFSDPYLTIGQMMLIRREDAVKYTLGVPTQIKGAAGVIGGTTGATLVERERPSWKRNTYSSGQQAADALINKRIELFVGDGPLVWYLAAVNEAKGLTVVRAMLTNEQLGWAVRKGDTELLNAANEYLRTIVADGNYQTIHQRWLPQN